MAGSGPRSSIGSCARHTFARSLAPGRQVVHAGAISTKTTTTTITGGERSKPAVSSKGSSGEGRALSSRDAEQEEELRQLQRLPVTEQREQQLVLWIGAAMAFGGAIWYTEGAEKAQEFFAGYLLEQSLSVDNLFVFVLVFNYFKTPESAQGKVLTYGILTAAVLRAVMILAGVELVEKFQPVLGLFAAILIFTSWKLLSASEEDEDDEDLSDNAIVKACRRVIPASDRYDGDRFFTVENGVSVATPLLLALAVVEISDVVFAVDSIPAVFGVTLDPFIIYTSNIFAILSLRALYTFVSTVMTELRYLDKAVALVLGFIGIKMLAGLADYNVPTNVSLLVVGLVLGGGVAASLAFPEQERD